MRTPARPRPLDLLGLLLAVAGLVVVLVTRQPEWTSVVVVATAATSLAGPDPEGRAWARAGLGLAGAGWVVAAATASLTSRALGAVGWVDWASQTLVLAGALALALVLRRRVEEAHAEAQHARDHAREAAVQDQLTGLANRKGLAMLAAPILESARRRGDAVYCVFVDVDGLSRVNADRGHRAGDEVLLAVADSLTRSTRATDAVARWGDDEFVVVGPGTGLPPLEIERRVRSRCRETPGLDPSGWQPQISAGGAVLEPWDDGDVDTLLRQAGREMQVRRALRREAVGPTYGRPHGGSRPDRRSGGS